MPQYTFIKIAWDLKNKSLKESEMECSTGKSGGKKLLQDKVLRSSF